jgi:hypothetical protein
MGELSFQLVENQSWYPVPSHPLEIITRFDLDGETLSSSRCITDENGRVNVSLSDAAIRDLERVLVYIKASASINFKESTQMFYMRDIFSRVHPSLTFNNRTSSLTLRADIKNTLLMSILADGGNSIFSGRNVHVQFFDGGDASLMEVTATVGNDGLIACVIPVQLLRAGQVVQVVVAIKATLVNYEARAMAFFHVVSIMDPAAETTSFMVTLTTIIAGSIAGLVITIKCVKRARYNFLSKDQFTIKLA